MQDDVAISGCTGGGDEVGLGEVGSGCKLEVEELAQILLFINLSTDFNLFNSEKICFAQSSSPELSIFFITLIVLSTFVLKDLAVLEDLENFFAATSRLLSVERI